MTRILYLFTRTPLHVGAGASVGAIDQPIQRERHTGFPIIPASSLKGSLADHWSDATDAQGKRGDGTAAWLFGSDDAEKAAAGALQFGEARLLAFPIRSARGSFAWITCPLILRRAVRDGVLQESVIQTLKPLKDDQAQYDGGSDSRLDLNGSLVLEDYTFNQCGTLPSGLATAIASKLPSDPVWKDLDQRLVVLSDGMMSFFARNACEVAQHVKINDETGTAADGLLFNQENVPSETVFYAVIHATASRLPQGEHKGKDATQALKELQSRISQDRVFQFGGDASTGLGYCSLHLP